MPRRLSATAFALLLLSACDRAPEGAFDQARADPRVEDAVVRLPTVPGRPGVAYFILHPGIGNDRLLTIATPAAQRAELHDSMTEGGMAKMRKLDAVDVTPGQAVTFAPGGKHVMLFGVDPSLTPGAQTTLTLGFADGQKIEAPARIEAALGAPTE